MQIYELFFYLLYVVKAHIPVSKYSHKIEKIIYPFMVDIHVFNCIIRYAYISTDVGTSVSIF